MSHGRKEKTEDEKIVCPISFHDCVSTAETWNTSRLLGKSLLVTAKGTLNVRYIQDAPAELFRDSDHPFRWFLAPYCSLYFFSCGTFEDYKDNHRPRIRKWMEASFGLSSSRRWTPQWLLVYVSTTTTDAAIVTKVSDSLAADFHVEEPGDSSTHLTMPKTSHLTTDNNDDDPLQSISRESLSSRVWMCVMKSYNDRVALYENEIQRLKKDSNTIDFRQLFLVKESLALMYQIMGKPNDALRQYYELDALIQNTNKLEKGVMVGDWPFLKKAPESSADLQHNIHVGELTAAFTEGQAVLHYSINSVRMRILKSEIGLLELKRYVFARQMFFLLDRKESLAKSCGFVTFMLREFCIMFRQQNKFPERLEFWQVYLVGATLALAKSSLSLEDGDYLGIEVATLLQFACARIHSLNCYGYFPRSHRSESQAHRSIQLGAADHHPAESVPTASGILHTVRMNAFVTASTLNVEEENWVFDASEIDEDEVLQLLNANSNAIGQVTDYNTESFY